MRALGCPPCHINFGPSGCVPCEEGYTMAECEGCFDPEVEEGFFARNEIWPAVVSGVIIAVATGLVVNQLGKRGIEAA